MHRAESTDLVTVVVNWNTRELLDSCLESIEQHAPAGLTNRVVVVDNASADGSVEHLRSHWPGVEVIANGENVGFCRANNQAIESTESDYLLLINTDARLTEGCGDRMLAYLVDDPRAAVVGPRLVYGDGSFQRWTAGDAMSLRSVANYYLALDRLSDRIPAFRSIYLAHDTSNPFRPSWVSSAVMLLRRSAFEEVGLLDEDIFVYMDDVDLCERATDAGWTVWYVADATAVHLCGASTKRTTGKASPEALRSFNRWFERHRGPVAGKAARAIEAVGFGARAGMLAGSAVVRRDPDSAQRARAHLTHLKLSLERTNA